METYCAKPVTKFAT